MRLLITNPYDSFCLRSSGRVRKRSLKKKIYKTGHMDSLPPRQMFKNDLNLKVKCLDLISTNSENSLDKTIKNSYNLLTMFKTEKIIVDYGDKQNEHIQLNSSINNTFKY